MLTTVNHSIEGEQKVIEMVGIGMKYETAQGNKCEMLNCNEFHPLTSHCFSPCLSELLLVLMVLYGDDGDCVPQMCVPPNSPSSWVAHPTYHVPCFILLFSIRMMIHIAQF